MKRLSIFLLLTSLICFSGCLTITEELFLQKDSSGTYVSSVNMNKMDELMEMIKQFGDSTAGKDMQKIMQDSIARMINQVKDIPGITEAKATRPDSSTYTFSFRFKNMQALNTALKRRKGNTEGDLFSFSNGTLICNDKTLASVGDLMSGINNDGKKMPNGMEKPEIDPEQIKGMFGMLGWKMTMKTIYHLPAPVSSVTNKQALISADKKTVTLEFDLLDDNKNKTLENTIQLN